jgi:AcrR family transcriptional regulator
VKDDSPSVVEVSAAMQEPTDRASFANRARKAGMADTEEAPILGDRALRTREHLIETAKKLFLERSYGGTTIENIAEAAGVSRASFYTYFPSKRETLLAAAEKGLEASRQALRTMSDIPDTWNIDHIKAWLRGYMSYMDEHGAFLLLWSQAAWQDSELRTLGVRGSMRAAGAVGIEMERLGGSHHIDPRIQGQAMLAMLDRFWYIWRVTRAPFSDKEVIDGLSHFVASMLLGSEQLVRSVPRGSPT